MTEPVAPLYAPLGHPAPILPKNGPVSAQSSGGLKFGHKGRAPKGAPAPPTKGRGPPPKETWRQNVFVRVFVEAPQGASCGLGPRGASDKLSADTIGIDGVYRGYPSMLLLLCASGRRRRRRCHFGCLLLHRLHRRDHGSAEVSFYFLPQLWGCGPAPWGCPPLCAVRIRPRSLLPGKCRTPAMP